MTVVVAVVVLVCASTKVCIAQDATRSIPTNSQLSLSSESVSASSSQANLTLATTVAQELAQNWFIANVRTNETQLAVDVNSELRNLSNSDIICNGAPSLQRLSDALSPNFGCPDIFTAIGASCTCLSNELEALNTWEFLVAKSNSSSEYPVTLSSMDVLPVDSIRTLWVPPTLKTLRVVGVGTVPQDIQFVPMDRLLPDTISPIAISNDSISISTVEITNINMFSITITASTFLPPTTTNLTLRNCNLFAFGLNFFNGVTSLQHLDLSSNSLAVPYAGSTRSIETLNLTDNSLTTFPTEVLNINSLQELYIAHNDITDFNVSNLTFNAIKSLRAFESDLPEASATCLSGTWQTAHNSTFCVINSTSLDSDSSTDSCANCAMYTGIIAGSVVLVLIVLLFWQRICSRAHAAASVSSSAASYLAHGENETISFQTSENCSMEALLNDPLIVNNRLNYTDIKLHKCLSRGGFGLVFVGEYKGRQVAVKKIRFDRSHDPYDVKAFFKEIILMADLCHPRIVEFIGVAWDQLKHTSAVTEYMAGGDLRHVLRTYKRQGMPLTWMTHKTTISLHIAEALHYLHSHSPKVIHRDLKSKNVLLNEQLEAKLTDFGVSRMQYSVQTHAMTAGIGTSFWIAPEVIMGRDYDEKADIYSFGIVLSEIDTDDYPFWNDANRDEPRGKLQEAEVLRQVVTDNKRPEFSLDCPDAIMALAASCLQENPEDRPSASAVVATLQQLLRPSIQSESLDLSFTFALRP